MAPVVNGEGAAPSIFVRLTKSFLVLLRLPPGPEGAIRPMIMIRRRRCEPKKKKMEEEKCSCNGRYFKKPTPTVVYSATIPPDSFQYSRQCVLNMFFFTEAIPQILPGAAITHLEFPHFFKKINI